jgi:hypothetical protein
VVFVKLLKTYLLKTQKDFGILKGLWKGLIEDFEVKQHGPKMRGLKVFAMIPHFRKFSMKIPPIKSLLF